MILRVDEPGVVSFAAPTSVAPCAARGQCRCDTLPRAIEGSSSVDVRDTPEQAEIRRTARHLARQLGPRSVADLEDGTRVKRLAEAVRDAGWLELRHEADEGRPLAGGVEAAIIAEALGECVADVAFTGPLLAADLVRRTGASPRDGAVVAFPSDLIDAA